jgi:simple sugar transport system permease protein
MYLTNLLIKSNLTVYNQARTETYKINTEAFLPKFGMDKILPGSRADIGFLIAILVAISMFIILNKTKFGFELKGVGYNRHASRYAGINEKKAIILSMAIAGALAALGGALKMIAPGAHNVGNTLTVEEMLAPEGFNGIPVALLGLSNPVGIIFSALFITYIQRGGFFVQSLVMIEIIDIIIGVIIYFSAFSLVIRLFFERRAQRKRTEAELEADELKPEGGEA